MAPVHSVNACSVSASSSEVRSNTESTDYLERYLPISSKGSFFQDSFFENARTRYEEKVKRILDDWEESDSLFDDWFSTASSSCQNKSCRNLQSQNQEVRVVTEASENGGIKILLDVREFAVEEIKIRVVGEREIEVEGHRKHRENNVSNSRKIPNNFHYLFSLPEDAEMDTITSAMSSDGILSISIPKKEISKKTILQIPLEVRERRNVSVSSVSNSLATSSESSLNLSQTCSKLSSNNSSELFRMEEEILDKFGEKIDNDINGYQSSHQLRERENTSQDVTSNNNVHSEEIKENSHKKVQVDQREFEHIESLCKGNEGDTYLMYKISINGANAGGFVSEKETEKHVASCSSSASFSDLAVKRRGRIADDSFFENIKDTLCSGGKNDLGNWEDISAEESETSICNFHKDEIIKYAEDRSKYMYVVDVRGFRHKDEIALKFVDDYELLIEIPSERKSNVPSFKRRLVLPQDIQIDSIHSSLSSDGFLLITVLKKLGEPKEIIVPIYMEETHLEADNIKTGESEETRGFQNTNTLIDDKDATKNDGHTLQVSANVINEFLSSKNLDSSIQRCESSYQRLEEKEIQEQKDDLVKFSFKESNYNEKDALHLENESQLGKNILVESKSTDCHQNKENSGKEIMMHSNGHSYSEVEALHHLVSETKENCTVNQAAGGNDINIEQLHTSEALPEKFKSYSVEWSAPDAQVVCSASSSSVSKIIHITKKGSFFSDVCFEGMQRAYLQAIKAVLSKCGIQSSISDEVTCYRNLKEEDLEENRAEITFETENFHHIVLDVCDLKSQGEISVKIVNENEITIESQATGVEDSVASTELYSKSFKFSGRVDVESAEAILSSEGVLLITIPKKVFNDETATTNETKENFINSSLQFSIESLDQLAMQRKEEGSDTTRTSTTRNDLNTTSGDKCSNFCPSQIEDSGMPCDLQKEDVHASTVKNLIEDEAEEKHSDHVPDIVAEDRRPVNETLNTATFPSQKCVVYESRATLDLQTANKNDQNEENRYQDPNMARIVGNDGKKSESINTAHLSVDKSSHPQDLGVEGVAELSHKTSVYGNEKPIAAENTESSISLHKSNSVSVKVEDRNCFSEDTFFEGMQNYLLVAVENILSNHYDMGAIEEDKMTLYRNGLNEDQQTASVSFEDKYYFKVAVDAHNVKNKDIAVTILDGKIIVEGFQEENKDEGLAHRHSKTFAVADDVDIHSAVAGISSDGFLAIVFRKKGTISEVTKGLAKQGIVSILDSSSSAVDSVFSPTAEITMSQAVESRDDTDALTDERNIEEEAQSDIYKCRLGGSQVLQNVLSTNVQLSSISDETESDKECNHNEDNDGKSELPAVPGTSCTLEINGTLTNSESTSTSSNISYKVSLAESLEMESDGLASNVVSNVEKGNFVQEGSSSLILEEKQMLEKSSKGFINSSTECEDGFHNVCLSSNVKTSENSASEIHSLCFNYSDNSSEFSGNQFISNSSDQPGNDQVSTEISRKDLFDIPTVSQKETERSMMSETYGFSQNTCRSATSYIGTSVQALQCTESRRLIALETKGSFFEDSFFSEVHESFLTAIKEALRKSNDEEKCKHSSDIVSYKCWRKHNTKFEKQAMCIHDDQSYYKVILDVGGLSQDSLMVSIEDGKKLLIEGQIEDQKNSSTKSKIYSRIFIIPDQVNKDTFTATISSDGILLIESPKM